MTLARSALALLLLAPLPAIARADDRPAAPAPEKKMIPNPTYAAWAAFKVGTSAKYEQDAGVADQKTSMTWKLVELGEDKLVLEMNVSSSMGGQTYDMPAQRTDVPKQVEEAPVAPDERAPRPEVKEGRESVTTPAGTFDCRKIETSMKAERGSFSSTLWTSTEVPGGTVKTVSRSEMQDGSTITSTMTLVSLTKA